MKYSIIGPGLVGNALHKQLPGSTLYSRSMLNRVLNDEHDVLIITAPTGNRLVVNQDPEKDLGDCDQIIDIVSMTNYNHLVYISTLDVYPDRVSDNANPSPEQPTVGYGHNRWFLEQAIADLSDSYIIRVSTLSDLSLNKNILYDLKTRAWLHKICLDSRIQWYPLKRLGADINNTIANGIKYQNICSQPVQNREIVERFFPELVEQLSQNDLVPVNYDIKNYNQSYAIPLDEVWQSFEEYFSLTSTNV